MYGELPPQVTKKQLGHDAYPRTNGIAATSKHGFERLISRQRAEQNLGLDAPSAGPLTKGLVVRGARQEGRIGVAGKHR